MSRWRTMEQIGAIWSDRLDNVQDLRNRGFVVGAPTLVVGPCGGRASSWGGSDYWYGLRSYADLSTESITLTLRSKGVVCATAASVAEVFGKRAWATATEAGFSIGCSSSGGAVGQPFLHYGDGTNSVDQAIGTGTAFNSAVWQHMALTLTRGGVAQLYVNGVANGSSVNIASVVGSARNIQPLRIMGTTSAGRRATGAIAEVAIFPRTLSVAEVLAIATYKL